MVRWVPLMTKQNHVKVGKRDLDVLESIGRCPLTAKQLFKLSQTFDRPFCDLHNLRRRLRKLSIAGLLAKYGYSIHSEGRSPSYWKLTRGGYRMLHGSDVAIPKRNYFEAIKPGHHHHTFCLAETIVHLAVFAKSNDYELIEFARENSIKLVAEPYAVYPDCGFVIRRDDGRTFSFLVELDNGTERVRSTKDVESIQRKIRGYDTHQANYDSIDPKRYIVLFVTTRSKARLNNILDVAAQTTTMPDRKIFVGCSIDELLRCNPFENPIFADHRGLKRTLVPIQPQYQERSISSPLLPTLAT